MVDPHLLASGVCEKERKSELNSRAAGKGVWHPSEGASRGAAAASKRARAARRRACGVGRGETMLADTRIPHHPHVRAHHAAIPPHSQAPSPSDAATPSGGLADDERDEAAAPPGWPARASRWPVQRGGTGSPILARALADARRSRERAKCGKIALFAKPSRRLHVGTSRIDDSPPAPACAPCNSIQNRYLVRPLNRSWRGATAILHLCSTTSYIVRRRRTRSSNRSL